ncbi:MULTISPECIES: fimbria/pilus outer membrane usher protein [Tenebrionibacter/Tenebrionicola group]|jgi:outer membrane usher protein|uniref:Fimbrial biogenesis outer membrane usher protein n=2 Tax=Tenebrionibacter/Tenebrionicola group TaxID=2969848 RepID=A0A8K0V7U7_9ENTR|nr:MULTISPECIES: fimbria/pilus outer membrane usher protein [Tenebrionibacter/Tenebrionicola group]MBK4716953.1 fimbrial biogenesis outer membrane usher protein [Tenebrionibacter intestinalis]MBV5097495.1 fimbrial biogenesis outer membrane usher protein [Tenebrionicola larvae]
MKVTKGNLSFIVVVSCCYSFPALANDEMYFDINALHLSDEQRKNLNLAALQTIDEQVEGEYNVLVLVNESDRGRHPIFFKNHKKKLNPVLTPAQLANWGIRVHVSPLPPDAPVEEISDILPGAVATFNFKNRTLNLSIPQYAMNNPAQGDIPPSEWDNGLTMAFMDYSLSGARIHNKSTINEEDANALYLNLRSGVNIAGWRLRNYSYYSKENAGKSRWNSLQTWIEKDLPALRAMVVAGQSSTPGLTMENFGFRGLSIASQDPMLPDSLQGYAPEIHGIALSSATVEVRQNGNLMYQTTVPPGEFIIRDMYPTTSSGELEIAVHEADGTTRVFTQAYASPPVSVRKGAIKYSLSAGKYDTASYSNNDTGIAQPFTQAELIYGLLDSTSVYAGAIAASHYHALRLGAGQSLGSFGAFSVDSTVAAASFSDTKRQQGQSLQFKYSKYFDYTQTSMTLAGYRYNAGEYHTFDEASNGYYSKEQARQRTMKRRMQLTLSQPLGDLGMLSVSAYQADYKSGSSSRRRSLTGSWTKAFDAFSITLNQSQSKVWRTGKTDNVTTLSFRIPLGRWLPGSRSSSLNLNSSWARGDNGHDSLTTTLSGTALENNNLSWSVSQARNRTDGNHITNSSAIAGAYKGSAGAVNLNYSTYSGETENFSWGVRGAILAHPYGITLTRQLPEGSGYALVRAPGASGVMIRNTSGLSTNFMGYAVIPSLMPYRKNDIDLDTATLADDTDITRPRQTKIPAREALVLADFKTHIGYRVFLTLSRRGIPLPMGSVVSAADVSGMVNESGQLYLAGVQDKSILTATVENGRKCSIAIDIARLTKRNGIHIGNSECK